MSGIDVERLPAQTERLREGGGTVSGEIVQDRTTGAWWWRCPRCGKRRTHRDRAWLREAALVHDTVCVRDREQTTITDDGEGTPSLLDMLEVVGV